VLSYFNENLELVQGYEIIGTEPTAPKITITSNDVALKYSTIVTLHDVETLRIKRIQISDSNPIQFQNGSLLYPSPYGYYISNAD